MKILYLSAHSILAYDECALFRELGHYVFCPDSFVEKLNPGDPSLRPQIEVLPEHLENYRLDMEAFHKCGSPGINNKENLSVEFLKRFDAVVVMHVPDWVSKNWARFQEAGVSVILRCIGQNWAGNELQLAPYRDRGLKIVRYSPREAKIPKNYLGGDCMIRFYKNPNEFVGWTGETAQVVCVGQHLQKRGAPCNWEWLCEVSAGFPRTFYGPGSETCSWGKGKLDFDEMKTVMRQNRVVINGGTWPASYLLTVIEQMMTGMPLVAVGPKLGHPHGWFQGHDLYEMGDIIENGVNGWCSDDMMATKDFIRQLLSDHSLAQKIGAAGRKTAIELWGKDKIKEQWRQFLASL